MNEPETPSTKEAGDFLSPASFIRAARDANPSFRNAIAVAGILAIVVTFVKFRVSLATLAFGAVAMIGLMILFLVFAQASKLTKSSMDLPAQVLVWAFLSIGIAVAVGLTGSAFFNQPIPFRDWIIRELSARNPNDALSPAALQSPTFKPPPLPPPSKEFPIAKGLIVTELLDAYRNVGWRLSVFDNWGLPPGRQTLRVIQGALTLTKPDGVPVSMSLDPDQLPIPSQYRASLAHTSRRSA